MILLSIYPLINYLENVQHQEEQGYFGGDEQAGFEDDGGGGKDHIF